jgi:hypothetical protein
MPKKAITENMIDHFFQHHVPAALEILRTLIVTQYQLFFQNTGGDEKSVSTR